MKRNIVEKIIEDHFISGEMRPRKEVTIRIDQTLTQDATGTMAYLQLEALNPQKLATELSVSYIDHNTIQIGYENFDDHRYLQTVAEKYGIYFSRAGNGICHQVHLERFALPLKTLLGSDSHTPTAGGIGMLGIGAGGLDVAVAMAQGRFSFIYPEVILVILEGKLPLWVSAKDIILTLLEIFSTKGNVGRVIEYGGQGVKSLSVPQRATIANMGAELGVTTSIFPSDENTLRFLKAQGRADGWVPLEADDGAIYERIVKLNLSSLEPLVALPHSPDNIARVAELEGLKVDQVIIGSCTNSSYQDLMIAAKMLEGRKVHNDVSFVVAPGSRQVLRMIADNGALSNLIAAGARVAEATCGFCIGNSQAPGTDSVSVRTSNRNFEGRSGTKSAKVYLTGVETAVATAIRGELTDPRTLGLDYPRIELPESYLIDDSMLIPPRKNRRAVKVFRGPNIGPPPENEPLGDELRGIVAIKVGDKITTDHIIPAGDKMKYRSNVPKYSEYVFAMIDENFSKRALEYKKEGHASIIVAGESYGQGSSREHAALCPMYLGVKAVVAKSFERIHTANLINFGILPLCFVDWKDYERLEQGERVSISDIHGRLDRGEELLLKIESSGDTIPLRYSLTDEERRIILAGGKLNYIRKSIG